MAKKFRVLIVDDQREVRRVLAMGVQTLNYPLDVVEVPSAEEAMLMAPGRTFDLVVTDVRLPGISGLELVNRLRRQNADIKIILMTGMTDHYIRREVEKANVFAHFYKPVEMADFLDAVERCLGVVETTFSPPPVQVKARPNLDVPTQVYPPPAAAPAAPPPPALPEPLTTLRAQLNASLTVLMEDDGKFIFQDGEHAELKSGSALLGALMAAVQAQRVLSLVMGKRDPEYVVFLDAAEFHLGLASSGPKRLLLAISPQPLLPNLTTAADALRRAAQNMHLFMEPPAPVAPAPQPAAEPAKPASGAAETLPPAADPLFVEPPPDVAPDADLLAALANVEPAAGGLNLDDLFGPAKGEKKPASLDDFWDDVAEKTGDIKLNESHLTYDQAKNMGLAPD